MNLFRVGGIQLSVHASFLLLPVLVLWENRGPESGFLSILLSLGLLLGIFVCVLLHELGHAYAARKLGIRVPRILLLPIGGMAEFERMPRNPTQEIIIAVAGPLVNGLIITVLIPFLRFPSGWEDEVAWAGANGYFLTLLLANGLMALFNMIPVFPMDGGRVLRALLAYKLPYLKATFIAATVAKVLAALFIAAALWQELWMLAVLFVFIIVVGEAEYRTLKRSLAMEERWTRYCAPNKTSRLDS